MIDPRHAQRILAILRGRWDEAEQLGPPQRVESFVEACRLCDVPAWVHERLRRADRFDLIGEEAQAGLQAWRTRMQRDNLLLLSVAQRAFSLLAGAGVTVVGLKGIDLLNRLYDPFDTRTLDDIDVLVPWDQLLTAVDVLEQAGFGGLSEAQRTHYIRSSHHLPMHSPGPIPVGFELHWNIAQTGRFNVDPQGLIDRAHPLDIDGQTILRMDDADLAAHLLLHHLTHYFDHRLKWWVDLSMLVEQPGFDWDRVVERIREWRATRACAGALLHLRTIWPELVPERVVQALPLGPWRSAATWPLRSDHPLELYRATRQRRTQLYLAAVFLERPSQLPGWLWHRLTRDKQQGENPLDPNSVTEQERPS